MTYDEIKPVLRAFLGAFEAFRKIGFRSDDMYCLVTASGELAGALGCYFHLKTQGKEFNIFLGPADDSTAPEYGRVSKAVSSKQVPQADLDRIWQESPIRNDVVGLLRALMQKGFDIPNPNAS